MLFTTLGLICGLMGLWGLIGALGLKLGFLKPGKWFPESPVGGLLRGIGLIGMGLYLSGIYENQFVFYLGVTSLAGSWVTGNAAKAKRELETIDMVERGRTGIGVAAGFFRGAFFLFACAPRIEIDGVAHKKSWGTHFFEVSPGTHEVTVYYVYLFKPRCGENSISVEVGEGRIAHVRYHMPPWMFAKGSLKLV